MNVNSFDVGRIVISTQGRDKGRLLVIVSEINADFVLLVDGDLRKLENPKTKRKKHIKPTQYIASKYVEKLTQGSLILNSDIKKELLQYNTDKLKGGM